MNLQAAKRKKKPAGWSGVYPEERGFPARRLGTSMSLA
jgi:hypothetical protein